MECSAYLHNIVSGCWELKRKFRLKLELEPIFIKIKDDKFCTTVGVGAGSIHSTENRDTERVSGAVWHSIARDTLYFYPRISAVPSCSEPHLAIGGNL